MADISGLYPQPPQPKNALADLPSLIQAMSFSNQNARFQQEFAAKKAQGQITTNALNPDGTIDVGKWISGIKDNPAAAYGAQEAYGSLLDQRQKELALRTGNFDLGVAQNDKALDVLGAAADDNNGHPDRNSVISRLVTVGRVTGIPSADIAARVATLPKDQNALYQVLSNYKNQRLGAAAVSARTAGPVGPQGQPTSASIGQLNQIGAVPAAPPAVAIPGAPAQAVPAATPAAPYGNLPRGIVSTGLPPGQAESANAAGTATGAASAAQGVSLQQAADNAPNRKAAIANLQQSLGEFTSGPMSGMFKTLQAAGNEAATLIGAHPPFKTAAIAAQEEFTKIATTLAAQQSALGSSTDKSLDTMLHANPSEILSPAGNRRVMNVMSGNEDAIAVKNREWQAYRKTHGDNSYGDFSTQFNKTFEPRVFQFPYMSPAERTQMFQSMSPAERKQVSAGLRQAEDNGWIKAP